MIPFELEKKIHNLLKCKKLKADDKQMHRSKSIVFQRIIFERQCFSVISLLYDFERFLKDHKIDAILI